MKTLVVSRNIIVLIFAVMLLIYGVQGISYAQELLIEPSSETNALLLYWTEKRDDSIIRRMDLANGQTQEVVTGIGSLAATDIAIDALGGKIYWAESFLYERIQRANLDGTDIQTVVGGLGDPTGIDLDVSGGKIYWVDQDEGKIQRADLDGANVEDVVTGLGEPTDVAIDVSGGKIYWTDYSGKIQRADLNGANVEDIVTGLGEPAEIIINVSEGKIYWVDQDEGKIQRANLDGTDIKDIATGFIWDIDIAIDVSGGKIYWRDPQKVKIQRANLDGANVEDVVTGLPKSALGVAFAVARILHKATLSISASSILSISPSSMPSPAIGKQLTLSLNIEGGQEVAGYQATVQFDDTALRYVESSNGDYLPDGAFFVPPIVEGNLVKLNATSLAGETGGDGTLATLTFEVIIAKASTLTLSDVLLINSAGESSTPKLEDGEITAPTVDADVNGDGSVNIQDLVLVASNIGQTGQNAADANGDGIVNIVDLVLVAGALGNTAAAPSLHPDVLEMLTAADVQLWLSQAQQLNLTGTASQRGILFLEQLLVALTPKETALLHNYPNPFNPETWIPYQLAKPANVTLHIYAVNGTLVRRLSLGHQAAGMYQNRSRAAYWDGRNALGEPVASGVYFYTLTAGDFTATRKMLIRK